MNGKIKKNKKKVKIADNEEHSKNSNQEIDENVVIKRKHTKVNKKKKEKKEPKIEEELDNNRKVKFGKIDIIDVESWKKLNLKLTAEENMEELYKISEGTQNKRMKNIGCTCTII